MRILKTIIYAAALSGLLLSSSYAQIKQNNQGSEILANTLAQSCKFPKGTDSCDITINTADGQDYRCTLTSKDKTVSIQGKGSLKNGYGVPWVLSAFNKSQDIHFKYVWNGAAIQMSRLTGKGFAKVDCSATG